MIWEFLHPFFRWSDSTWIGEAIRDSRYLFPVINTVHLLALTVLLGAISVMNLRLLGLVLPQEKIKTLAGSMAPWMYRSLTVMLITGWLLLASEAEKCYRSGPFQLKMSFLFGAGLFHFTLYRKATQSDEGRIGHKIAALVSTILWFSVGFAGRAIGYF